MKKTLTALLAVLMLISASGISVLADSFVVAGESFSYVLNDEGTYTITGYDGDDEVVQIPAYIDGIAVTELGDYSLYNDITGYKVVIPETIKAISPTALICNNITEVEVHPDNEYYCDIDGVLYNKDVTVLVLYPENREELSYEVPSTVTELGEYCFHYGGELEEIILPQGLKKIGVRAFYFVDTLKRINLPEGLKIIGDQAFLGCSGLEDLYIPDSVTSLGNSPFDSCSGLKSIYIGSGIGSIEGELLAGCYELETITVAEDNKILTVKDGVLFNKDMSEIIKYPAKKADTSYEIPSTVKTIGKEAFYRLAYLENVTLPDGVETLEEAAFWDCSELRSIEIPDSVTYMEYGFSYCPKLERVYIGKNIERIDYYSSFSYCDSLVSIEVDEDNPCLASRNGVLYSKDMTEIIKFPKGLDMKNYKIPASVKEVYYAAFHDQNGYYDELYEQGEIYVDDCLLEYDYQDKGNVVVRTGTRIIGNQAFWAESNIWGISLPEDTQIICGMAFSSMFSLQAIYIPESVKYMGDQVFWASSNCYEIYYGGSEEQWNSIENIENADIPEYANIYFNSEGNEFVNPVLPEDMYDNTYVNEETGISVSTDTDAQLNADNITSEEIVASVDELLPKAKVEAVYEINLEKDGEEIQPEDLVMVKIPTKNRFARVYRLEEDGSLTDMNAVYENGYLIFYTDHFSFYALGMKQASEYELGDVDMNESLNVKDATAVQKYLADITEFQDDVIALLMDFDSDSNVNVKDATAIQKAVAGLL